MKYIPIFDLLHSLIDIYLKWYGREYRAHCRDKVTFPLMGSVNVSRLALFQPDLIKVYADIKEKYKIQDKHIELEFVESFVFDNHILFQSIIPEFQNHGFLCSLFQ